MLEPLLEVLVSRSPLVVVLLTAGVAISLVACSSSGKQSKPRRSTTTSSKSSTTTSTAAGGSSTTSTPSSSTTAPGATIGTCGNQTAAIVGAIENSSQGGLNTQRGKYTVQRCRIATSSPIWAAAAIVPNPGVQLDGATVVLQRIGALWNVEQVGTSNVGCNVAPASVISDLGLIC